MCVCSGYVCLVSVGSIGTRTPPFTPSTFNCFLADSHICAAARFWLRLTRLRTGYVYPDCEQTDAERSFGTVKTEQFRLTYSFVCTFQQWHHSDMAGFSMFSSSLRAHLHVVGMLQFMSDINQPSLLTPFYSVHVSTSVFVAFLTVCHSKNSLGNSPFFHSVLPVLFLPYWCFQLYISLRRSPSALI